MVGGQSSVTSYQYNSLGDRLHEIVDGNPTTFTMDLNTELTQALSDGTYSYVYGNSRIAQSQIDYYLNDALDSVRQMTDVTGAITYTRSYDPYGVVAGTSGASQTAYGYTGEYQDSAGMVYLRARHYAPRMGRFLTRDTWGGNAKMPMSLNRWSYTNANPVNYTDPSGHFPPLWCQFMPSKASYELCVDIRYQIEPIKSFEIGKYVSGSRGCYHGPTKYRAQGYLEGLGIAFFANRAGTDVVYDFARMERGGFGYQGAGVNDAFDLGVGAVMYAGGVGGLRSDVDLMHHYRGASFYIQSGPSLDLGIGLGGGVGYFESWNDLMLRGVIWYVGASIGLDVIEGPAIDIVPVALYWPATPKPDTYVNPDGSIDIERLSSDILSGEYSVWGPDILSAYSLDTSPLMISLSRNFAVWRARHYAKVYTELHNEKQN